MIDNWEPIQTQKVHNVEFTQKTTACGNLTFRVSSLAGILDENHEAIIEIALLKRLQMSKLKQPKKLHPMIILVSAATTGASGPCWIKS